MSVVTQDQVAPRGIHGFRDSVPVCKLHACC